MKIKAVRQIQILSSLLAEPAPTIKDQVCLVTVPPLIIQPDPEHSPLLAGLDNSCGMGLTLVKLDALIPAKYFLIS